MYRTTDNLTEVALIQPRDRKAWALPKGLIEPGEQPEHAAQREAREETGLTVKTGEMLGVYERVIRSEDGRVRYHYVLIDFLCRVLTGDLQSGSDAADVRWFTREELDGLNLPHDTRDVIEKGFRSTTGRQSASSS